MGYIWCEAPSKCSGKVVNQLIASFDVTEVCHNNINDVILEANVMAQRQKQWNDVATTPNRHGGLLSEGHEVLDHDPEDVRILVPVVTV